MEVFEIIARSLSRGGADVYIVPGSPLVVKTKGKYETIDEHVLTASETEILLREIYGMDANRSLDELLYSGDDDFSFSIPDLGRFRCNAYRQMGSLAAVLRVVSFELPDPVKLHIPETVMELADIRQGLVIVTGPSGSGRTTTLACMIDRINRTRNGHIVTVEDPVEYIHPHKRCLVSQREVRIDTGSFSGAVRSALRQGADVIMLSEMRDAGTIQTAVNAAETGRLVLAGGDTTGIAKAVGSILDTVAVSQHQLLDHWLSSALAAVVTQQLLPTVDGDVIPIFNVVRVNDEIREKLYTGKGLGNMEQDMDAEIFSLWSEGRISRETALKHAIDPIWMADMIK